MRAYTSGRSCFHQRILGPWLKLGGPPALRDDLGARLALHALDVRRAAGVEPGVVGGDGPAVLSHADHAGHLAVDGDGGHAARPGPGFRHALRDGLAHRAHLPLGVFLDRARRAGACRSEVRNASARHRPSTSYRAAFTPWVPMSTPDEQARASACTAAHAKATTCFRPRPFITSSKAARVSSIVHVREMIPSSDTRPAPTSSRVRAVLGQALAGGARDRDLLVVHEVRVEGDLVLPLGQAAEEHHPAVQPRQLQGRDLALGRRVGGDDHVDAPAAGLVAKALGQHGALDGDDRLLEPRAPGQALGVDVVHEHLGRPAHGREPRVHQPDGARAHHEHRVAGPDGAALERVVHARERLDDGGGREVDARGHRAEVALPAPRPRARAGARRSRRRC